MKFSSLWTKLKEIIQRMLGMNQTIEQTLHIAPAINSKMAEAIDEWTRMYEDKAEWLHEPSASDPTLVVSLGLPAFIASEKARMAVLELKSEITVPKEEVEQVNPNYFPPTTDMLGNVKVSGESQTIITETAKSPVERANFMNDQYQKKLISKIRTQLEFGIAKGGLIIKPYVIKQKAQAVAGIETTQEDVKDTYEFGYDFVQADCFYPFAFDSNGNLSEVAFLQTKTDKDIIYTRLEYHKLVGNNVQITNRAFENSANNMENLGLSTSLGKEVGLNCVPEWKNLPRDITIKNVNKLLFGYFKMPEANTIDPHSPMGISGFARAKYLIREADKQYSRLLWEYEGGELAIDIDRDALNVTDRDGKTQTVMGHLQQRLYRPIDLGESNTYQPYSPALRDASMINGLNNILMRIEDVCSLSRGTISEVASEARTATELKILKQRSYSSNAEIQAALETALRDVVYAMNVYCTLYNIVDDVVTNEKGEVDATKLGDYDVSFTWDDSIIVDVDAELSKRLSLMQNGLTSKREVRMWYFGETRRQADEALKAIQKESQEAIEQNMLVSSQMGKQFNGGNNETPNKQEDEGDKKQLGAEQQALQDMANTQKEEQKESTEKLKQD